MVNNSIPVSQPPEAAEGKGKRRDQLLALQTTSNIERNHWRKDMWNDTTKFTVPKFIPQIIGLLFLSSMCTAFVALLTLGAWLFFEDWTPVLYVMGTICLGLILFVSFTLRRYVFNSESQTVTFSFNFLGLIPVYIKKVPFNQFSAVRFHTSVISGGSSGGTSPVKQLCRQIVLVENDGTNWLVGEDQRFYYSVMPCSKADGARISEIMELPYQEAHGYPKF
jgi:hypothetical protein